MIQLQPGQNTGLTGDTVLVNAKAAVALDISALVVAENMKVFDAGDFLFADRPSGPGVELGPDGVRITPAQVRADAKAVLLVVSSSPTAGQAGELDAVTSTVTENGTPSAQFVTTPTSGEAALICLEVYRRGAGWKVRAVGQGYAGGLDVLLRAHGVDITEAAATPGAHHLTGPMADEARGAGSTPLEVGHGLERLWMIFEDAARSAAALESAREYAAKRLDHESSEAVSDPATRNTQAGAEALRRAQQRSDELIATAERNHQRDAEQLIRELAEAEAELPPALAAWHSPAWDGPAKPGDGIRLGELYSLERGPLRVPYCVPVPLNRPLWIDTESSAAVAPVVGALLARLLAVAPQRRTRLDVIDLTGAFTGFLGLLTPVLNGPPVTDHSDISARLQSLVEAAELAELAYTSGAHTPPTEHRVLLAADFPHGYQSADAQRIGALLSRGDLIGLSVVIVGSDESDSGDQTVAMLSQSCRHLPTVQGTPLFDPWTGSPWQLDLDALPTEPSQQARYLRAR